MECLDANVVQDLMSGALDSGARQAVLGHLDTCADCRELLVVTARDSVKEALAATVASDGSRATEDTALAATLAPGDPEAHAREVRAVTARPAQGVAFGRYELLERLGAGAMGVVWRADDPELGRKVALKLLKRPDAALTDRLVREARSMAQVNHPNVVAVYDVGVHDGATYIAMELVQGQSLRAWQTSKSHTVPQLLEAYVAAGRGLAAAHAAGLVHRDFKPDNVLVGDDGRVRVTDFGLAAVKPGESGTHHAIGDVNLTTSGSVLGTPAYMAPEQFTGGNVDTRTDQFNFCVALYEALYGERPFEGKTFAELGDNVCEGRVKPAPEGKQISSALRAILLRGMSVKPGDRFPTMDHLLAELGRDRARPWRLGTIAFASIGLVLAIGLASDYVVRSRGERSIRQAFAATGMQAERSGLRQAKLFRAASSLVSLLPVMLDVSSHHDEADFGLGSPEHDADALQILHDKLVSQSWGLFHELGADDLAIVDYKGRVLYTSAAPAEWNGSLAAMPVFQHAQQPGNSEQMLVVRYDDPAFTNAKLFGVPPRRGLALMSARTFEHADQFGGVFLQFIDGANVLDGISVDKDTQLALVAPDGATSGDVAPQIARAAPADGSVGDVTAFGDTYQVQARPLSDFAGKPIAQVVMARPLANVLSLFPHARAVFAFALLGMLAGAFGTAVRARQITGARV
ncbi:MAG: protein kinase domain-containing protein [Acidobacteriota bacterium]